MKITHNTRKALLGLLPSCEYTAHEKVATLYSSLTNSVIGVYGKDAENLFNDQRIVKLQSITYMFGLQGSQNAVVERGDDVKTFLTALSPATAGLVFQQYLSFLKQCLAAKAMNKNTHTFSLKHKNKIVRFCWIDTLLVSVSHEDFSLPIRTMSALQQTYMKFFNAPGDTGSVSFQDVPTKTLPAVPHP